jgi:hypothetical protein
VGQRHPLTLSTPRFRRAHDSAFSSAGAARVKSPDGCRRETWNQLTSVEIARAPRSLQQERKIKSPTGRNGRQLSCKLKKKKKDGKIEQSEEEEKRKMRYLPPLLMRYTAYSAYHLKDNVKI